MKFTVYQKTAKTRFATVVDITLLNNEYKRNNIVEEWLIHYKYKVTLGLSCYLINKIIGVTKLTDLEQLFGLILPVFYDNGALVAKVVITDNNVGVSLLTLESATGYRANIHKENVIIAIKLGLARLINAKLAPSNRSKTGKTIKITDKNVINYNKWLKEQDIRSIQLYGK